MNPNIEDASILFESYLSEDVKNNMQAKIYSTLVEISTGVFSYVIPIIEAFETIDEKDVAIRILANKVNCLYNLKKLHKGYLFKAVIIFNEKENKFTACSYPLFCGSKIELDYFVVNYLKNLNEEMVEVIKKDSFFTKENLLKGVYI